MKSAKMKKSRKNQFKGIIMLGLSGLSFYAAHALAANTGNNDLAAVAQNITSTFKPVAQLITAAAYIAGFGFAVAAILKFKAHKDNPTQVPVGTPIALLFISVAMIFMPSLFTVGGKTVFGDNATYGGVSGVSTIQGVNGGGG